MEAVHTHEQRRAPGADESWKRVAAALDPNDTRETLDAMRADARHHTAEHLAAIGRSRTRPFMILGVASFALAAAAVLFWVPRGGMDRAIEHALGSANARKVSTENGQRGSVKLGDGTLVSLGARSALTIADGFGTTLRAVGLAGTATFEPAVNAELPFVVAAGNVLITATGTTFDLAASAEDGTVTVRVRAGSVEVATAVETRTIGAGSAALIAADGAIADASPTVVAEAVGWVDGEIVIAGRPLGEALPILRRWYGLTLTVDEKTLLERPLTMRASVDSMRAAIRELQRGANVIVDYDGKKNRVWDAARRQP